MAVRRIAAHYALLPEGLVRNVVVTVGEGGEISHIGTVAFPDREPGVEFYSGILIPGLVNAHCHLELSHLAGKIPPGCGFTAFAAAIGQAGWQSTERERLDAASFRDAQLWAEGVSAVGDVSNTGITFPVKRQSRVKYHTFMEVYGLETRSAAPVLRTAMEGARAGLAVSVTPHSMYSLNEGLLDETVSAGDGILSVHFMESPDEADLFRGRGAMREWYRGRGFGEDFTERYPSPAERLLTRVPAGRKLLLVHNTYVTREEVERIVGRFGNNVTWVLCPRSNRYITGDLPPVRLLRGAGCRIAVGTDSLASNSDLSMIGELKQFEDVPLEELLRWATCNGSAALGIYDVWGSIEQGKKPGLAILERVDLDRMRLWPDSASRRIL